MSLPYFSPVDRISVLFFFPNNKAKVLPFPLPLFLRPSVSPPFTPLKKSLFFSIEELKHYSIPFERIPLLLPFLFLRKDGFVTRIWNLFPPPITVPP